MFLSNASIRRPVAMSALLIALAILGFNAYRTIRLEFMPKVDFPYITVLTVYPGGSPSDIEVDIAKRVEDAVVSIDGVKHVNSVAMENVCQTLIEFQMGVDVDVAANDVRSKLDLILVDLPEGCEKPKVLKFDINRKGVQGIDWGSPLARQYGLESVPSFKIFDPQGQLRAEGQEAYTMVVQLLMKEQLW